MNHPTKTQQLFFRHLTPRGEGGISTFLIQGQNNQDFLAKYFKSFNNKISASETGRFNYGKLFDTKGELIDEIIVSTVGQDKLEIHSHGGNISTRAMIKFLVSIQFQQMPESHFGSIEPKYHYQHALKNIATINEYQFLKNQIDNFRQIQKIKLTENEMLTILKNMIVNWQKEMHYRRRASICLAGIPNAGKSSLINAVTGKKRSLVSSRAKTTRDTVTENFQTRGYRIKLIDTAGLHNPDNQLDQESIKQAHSYIANAEIILWLHDITLPFSEEENIHLNHIHTFDKNKPIWLVLTKADIQTQFSSPEHGEIFGERCMVSSQSGIGIENLLEKLVQFLFPQSKDSKQLTAISEQMAIEIAEFLQKVDLLPAKHKMVSTFFNQILNCIPD